MQFTFSRKNLRLLVQSFSLLHTKRFDNLRELFMSNRRQQRLEEQERQQIILDSDPRLNLDK